MMKKMLGIIPFILFCAVCGGLTVAEIEWMQATDLPFGAYMLTLLCLVLALYLAFFLQIILHEAGHWVCGLITGYRFSSFRIGSFMWIRQNGHIRFKRFTLAGTAGQCLLIPPPLTDGGMPYVLYNLGGCLANLVAVAISITLLLCCPYGILHFFLMLMGVIGMYLLLVNGIPMNVGGVSNDGYNARSLGKSPSALHAFWLQMKINEQQAAGVRLRDMPAEWFDMPSVEELNNNMCSTVAVMRTNWLMDRHEFAEAAQNIDMLSKGDESSEIKVLGIYLNMMACDRIFCELIGEGEREKVASLLTKDVQAMMKQMKSMITILRTEYVLALLYHNKPEKAVAIEALFEKQAAKYPHPAEVEAERELMQLAKEKSMLFD